MGIFPIIMNIVQFWLIDSIVKASNAINLDSSSSDPNDDEHREPLFGVPSDDEDDEAYKPGDIEDQRRNRYSRSSSESQPLSRDKSFSTEITVPDETKSTASTSNLALRDEHSYPPSLSSSVTSAGSPNNDHLKVIKPAKNLMKKKRRGPPAPILVQPVGQPAINSPQPSAAPAATSIPKEPVQQTTEARPPTTVKQASTEPEPTEWADSWDDADDWATRVGEEEWTGRRLEDKKQTVNSVWQAKDDTPNPGTH